MKMTTMLVFGVFLTMSLSVNGALIHHWQFEGSPDDSVGSVTGTLQGDATYAEGITGQALSLDGLGDFVSTNVTSAIVPATDYTMTVWVFWDGGQGYRGRVASGQSSGSLGEVFTLSRAADGSDRKLFLNLLPNGGSSITESADNTISTGKWMHLAYTLSSTDGVKLYMDGNLVATNTALLTHTPAANFAIGARPDTLATNPDFFDGLIDDLRIYDTALSAGEIAGIMAELTSPTVNAGSNWTTWSEQPVTINDAVAANNDPGAGDLTLLWTSDSPAGVSVELSATDVIDPTVTIIKDEAAANPTTVTLTLTVTQVGKEPVTDSMQIDVYNNSCDAAKSAGSVAIDQTDFNGDCVTNLEDLAIMAVEWLVDYAADGPVAK